MIFEWLLKLVGPFLGFVYLAGFVVVAGHLSRYGISSISLFHVQYLAAGAWVVAPVVIMRGMQVASQQFIDQTLAPDRIGQGLALRRRAFVALMASVPGLIVIFAVSTLLVSREPGAPTWGIVVALWGFYWAMTTSGDLLWLSWRTPSAVERTWWAGRKALAYCTTLLVSVFLAYVIFFAIRIYPLIPYSLGGGKPVTVVFLLGEKEAPDFLARDVSSRRSVPYKLLAATDKTFVIAPFNPNERSIEFSRDMVEGVVVLKEPPGP